MNNATTFTYDASAANRSAYAGQLLLTKNHTASTDSWETGINNNELGLGSSGGGKTRNHLKPNLMQCQGSYVVLDTKGSLYYELGPYLRSRGYKVDLLDFTLPLHSQRGAHRGDNDRAERQSLGELQRFTEEDHTGEGS